MGFGDKVPPDPAIRTGRLLLRPLAFADAPALFEAIDASRAELTPWLPWAEGVRKPDDLLVFIDRTMRKNREGEAHRAIIGPDGRLAGHLSIEDVQPSLRSAELGYWVRTDCAGRGYATEAARALLAWGFRHLDLHRVTAYADIANLGSTKVLEKAGFRREGVVRDRIWSAGAWRDHALYGLLEGEAGG